LGCAEYGAADAIVIGTAFAFTGLADLGPGELRGTQLAVSQRGMLFGRSLAILSEDAQCDPDGGATAALALVADPKIAAVVGTSCSRSAVVAAPIISEAGYSMVSPSNTTPQLTDSSMHEAGYLRVAWNDRLQAEAMASFAHDELGAATSAIIRQDDGYAAALADSFVQGFADIGGTNLVIEVLDSDSPDVGAAVSSIVASGPPDLIYLLAFEPLGSQVVAEIRDASALDETLIATSESVILPDTVTEGVYATAVAPPSGPAYDAFVVAYEVEFGDSPASVFDAYAFDATNMILDAVAAVGSELAGTLYVGRQELRDALFATTELAGVTGEISCDSYGDCAESQTVQLWQVEGGEFIQVAP
jgi:branched-chain amino acid transport system substrate-binding protein